MYCTVAPLAPDSVLLHEKSHPLPRLFDGPDDVRLRLEFYF